MDHRVLVRRVSCAAALPEPPAALLDDAPPAAALDDAPPAYLLDEAPVGSGTCACPGSTHVFKIPNSLHSGIEARISSRCELL